MPASLKLIIDQFSEHADTIRLLYSMDEDFRTLCDDYYMSQMNTEKIKNRLKAERLEELEYRDLSLNLEKEILDYIKRRE